VISLLGIFPTEMHTDVQKKVCKGMFITVFLIVDNLKQVPLHNGTNKYTEGFSYNAIFSTVRMGAGKFSQR
jgi:hypothetical protein